MRPPLATQAVRNTLDQLATQLDWICSTGVTAQLALRHVWRQLDLPGSVSWERQGDHVITYYGKPRTSPEFCDLRAEKAGVTGGPNVIRHTVRTWLAERGVPDS